MRKPNEPSEPLNVRNPLCESEPVLLRNPFSMSGAIHLEKTIEQKRATASKKPKVWERKGSCLKPRPLFFYLSNSRFLIKILVLFYCMKLSIGTGGTQQDIMRGK